MTANTPASRKAKGRLCAQEIKEVMFNAALLFLELDDIQVTSSSVTGADIILSPKAKEIFPVVIEAKCQESLSFWAAIEQAESHKREPHEEPLMVFKRNRTKLRAVVDFAFLCDLLVSRAT
jgi:hypothetical protein